MTYEGEKKRGRRLGMRDRECRDDNGTGLDQVSPFPTTSQYYTKLFIPFEPVE